MNEQERRVTLKRERRGRKRTALVPNCCMCRKDGHRSDECPKRKPGSVCTVCYDLPHRREKPKCLRCGREASAILHYDR